MSERTESINLMITRGSTERVILLFDVNFFICFIFLRRIRT